MMPPNNSLTNILFQLQSLLVSQFLREMITFQYILGIRGGSSRTGLQPCCNPMTHFESAVYILKAAIGKQSTKTEMLLLFSLPGEKLRRTYRTTVRPNKYFR